MESKVNMAERGCLVVGGWRGGQGCWGAEYVSNPVEYLTQGIEGPKVEKDISPWVKI